MGELNLLSERIAFFGGSFDPVHRGHVAIAKAAADQFSLDTVLFAPVGKQPLKKDGCVASFADRLAMAALACETDRRFRVSAIDAPRPEAKSNYTVETLTQLANEHPQAALFSLAGADSFRGLSHWREPLKLLALAEWIVVSRPGFYLNEPDSLHLNVEQRRRIHLLGTVREDVSATRLRQRVRHGESCDSLLPQAVAEYIARHALYREAEKPLPY